MQKDLAMLQRGTHVCAISVTNWLTLINYVSMRLSFLVKPQFKMVLHFPTQNFQQEQVSGKKKEIPIHYDIYIFGTISNLESYRD